MQAGLRFCEKAHTRTTPSIPNPSDVMVNFLVRVVNTNNQHMRGGSIITMGNYGLTISPPLAQ